jgi:hypothetical protein
MINRGIYIGLVFLLHIGCTYDHSNPLVGEAPTLTDSIVWVATDTIEHTRDYYSFTRFVNPAFPHNWLFPVNYSAGKFTLRVELIKENSVSARPIYYSVGWLNADGSRFTRVTVLMDNGPGVYEWTDFVKNSENVVNGISNGSIGNNWSWTSAWQNIAGDAWGANSSVYPFAVKVSLIFK